MKKFFVILALVCASLLLFACGKNSEQKIETSDSFSANMLVVHRVFIQPTTYGRGGAICIRSKTGEDILIKGDAIELGDLKYLQPGDTVFFRATKSDPEIFRVGFKD